MKLSQIEIKNFRKLHDVMVNLDEATFLIGANNAGKTSTLEAIELLLTGGKLDSTYRSRYISTNNEEITCPEDIVISGLFTNVDPILLNSRGFNPERLIKSEDLHGHVSYSFRYRLRFSEDNKTHKEMEMHTLSLKSQYAACNTLQDFIDSGADSSLFEGRDISKRLTPKERNELATINADLFDVREESLWFENPGGIPGNVLSKLPRYLRIGASVLSEEIEDVKVGSTLYKLLSFIFEDVRSKSVNYQKAVEALNALSKEMNPDDQTGAFGKLMHDLNKIVDDVFPTASINITTDLSRADSLKPLFGVTMSSNVSTNISNQGTGLIRSAVFALLRFYKQHTEKISEMDDRGLIIGFEEPELFLHPNAAENMRKVIYELAGSNSQIIATTHSPYMIDLSQQPKQVLNSFSRIENEFSVVIAFNLSEAFTAIQEDDRTRVKMIQKIDDYISRVFFAQKVIVVEGDTEDIVFKKTIKVMPEDVSKEIFARYQIIKATGKATMISFIRYLKALNVDIFVVHDEDSDTPGAYAMNEPILNALNRENSKRYMMHKCIEDELGYKSPSKDKPYNAYKFINTWTNWQDVPDNWKSKMKIIFSEFADRL